MDCRTASMENSIQFTSKVKLTQEQENAIREDIRSFIGEACKHEDTDIEARASGGGRVECRGCGIELATFNC
jgi:hypothetical protein